MGIMGAIFYGDGNNYCDFYDIGWRIYLYQSDQNSLFNVISINVRSHIFRLLDR